MKISALIVLLLFFITSFAFAGWSTPVRIAAPGGFEYPQILAFGDTLHVIAMHEIAGRGIGYVRSTDGGQTWSQEIELSDVVNTFSPEFPRIMRWRSSLLVVWGAIFFNGWYLRNVGYSISHNNGLTWSTPAYILASNWWDVATLTASNNDSLVNIFITDDDTTFFNIRSTNFGANWSDPVRIFGSGYTIRPDQASTSNIAYYLWDGILYNGEPDYVEIYCTRSTDEGLSWLPSNLLSTFDSHPSQYPAVAINETGDLVISWTDSKYSPSGVLGDVLMRVSIDSGATWGPEKQITYSHSAFDSDICWAADTIHVVWEDNRFGYNTVIYYRFSADSGQSFSPEEILVGDTVVSEYPAVASSNGRVYVVWHDNHSNPDTSRVGGLYFIRRIQGQNGIGEGETLPEENGLYSFPNPFNSSCIITYSLNDDKGGELFIYNIQGQKIRDYDLTGKEGKIIWDASDAIGNKVSSGIYFAKVLNNNNAANIKLIYLK
jgi:hypothetical protein